MAEEMKKILEMSEDLCPGHQPPCSHPKVAAVGQVVAGCPEHRQELASAEA